mgnify:CR=1 FL=1
MKNLLEIKRESIFERNVLIFMGDIDKDRRIEEESLI